MLNIYVEKYICANARWLFCVLAFTYRVIIDRFINSPGRGGSKTYGNNLSEKSYLRQNMCMIVTE